jgi:3-oxoacyl-[acyl-carrier protein] reductase
VTVGGGIRFAGKRALVTGSSRGIGRATAIALAREGAAVAIHYARDRRAADEALAAVEAAGGAGGGRAVGAFAADLASWGEATALVDAAAGALGGLDVFVALAGHGSAHVWNAPLEAITEAEFDAVLATDLKGSFATCCAAARYMRERGGAIVAVGSIPALAGDTVGIPYAIAKAGVLGMTRVLARALAPAVRVNAVALGSIATGWLEWISEEERQAIRSWIPLGRFGSPDEVARAILFLASADAAFITGQTLVVDGGEVMR